MNENIKELLAGYYLEFCKRRKSHFRDKWIPVSFKRILNFDSSASKLIRAEIDFEAVETVRFNRFIQEEGINSVDVNDYLRSLKLFRDELVNRNMFIIVNMAITGVLAKIVGDMLLTDSLQILSDGFFIIIYAIAIILLVERDGLSKRSNAASQLSVIIDK
jgi:hypothetical protein